MSEKMDSHDRAWLDELEGKGAEMTAKEKKIADRVIEIERRVGEVVKKSGVDCHRFIIETTNAKGDVTSCKLDHREFAEWLVGESGERFITVRGDDAVYMYEDGVYIEHGESFIKSMLYNVMGGVCVTRHGESEVLSHIRAMTYSDRSVFEGSDDVINMDNGLYIFSTGMFLDHTPEYKTLIKSAVKYDPNARCPAIDKFFTEIAEPERLMTLYEIMGYALMPVKSYKRGFIFRGGIDTGKSQYCGLLSAFVGEKMTAAVEPTTLAKYEHAGAELYGKLVNIIDDLGETPITDTGVVKAMIGDGLMRMNPKGKEAATFRAHVLNVWCCNTLPKVSDKHFGDKFDILLIDKVYGGHDKPDPHLLKKITEPEELSGLFNKAIAAFRGVEKRVGFTGSKSSRGRADEWERVSRPISQFVETKCRLITWSPDEMRGIVLKDGFYKAYTEFVNSINSKVESRQSVRKYLEETYSVFETRNRMGGDNPKWCYIGIEIIPVSENENLCQQTFEKKPQSSEGGVSVVSTNFSMLETIEKEKEYIESSMENKGGTNNTNHTADNESGEKRSRHIPDTLTQPSKPIDLDQSTIDRIRKATSDAMAKSNNSDGCDIDQITSAARGLARTTVAKCVLLNPGGAWAPGERKGLYRLRT